MSLCLKPVGGGKLTRLESQFTIPKAHVRLTLGGKGGSFPRKRRTVRREIAHNSHKREKRIYIQQRRKGRDGRSERD